MPPGLHPERPFQCGRFRLSLGKPLIMGVINVTPDSFYDGGAHAQSAAAIEHGLKLVVEGADILDIGGESTRPGSLPVDVAEELARILPVLDALTRVGVPLSVDTTKPEVMRQAVAAGADMINDVAAFRAPGALDVMADSAAALCIMHMQGEPRTMQSNPHYDDVVAEVAGFLQDRAHAAEALGIVKERIVLDPGFGFGKTLGHNLLLLKNLGRLADLGWPVLAGLSRKSMLGKITGRDVQDRVHASVAAALLAVVNGARIVRVHDVGATRDALDVFDALNGCS